MEQSVGTVDLRIGFPQKIGPACPLQINSQVIIGYEINSVLGLLKAY